MLIYQSFINITFKFRTKHLFLAYFVIACLFCTKTAFAQQKTTGTVTKNNRPEISWQDSLKKINTAIAKNPPKGENYYKRADLYLSADKYKEALDDYHKAIELKYETSELYTWLGYTYTRLTDMKNAVRYLTKALELNPKNFLAYSYRGYAFLIMDKAPMAEEDYKIYVRQNPDDYVGLFGIARSQELQHKYTEAIKNYEQALKNNPTSHEAYLRIGICYAKMNDLQNSIASFDSAIALKPDEGLYYFNRGIAKGKSHQNFCPDFKKAAELGNKEGAEMYEKFCTQH